MQPDQRDHIDAVMKFVERGSGLPAVFGHEAVIRES